MNKNFFETRDIEDRIIKEFHLKNELINIITNVIVSKSTLRVKPFHRQLINYIWIKAEQKLKRTHQSLNISNISIIRKKRKYHSTALSGSLYVGFAFEPTLNDAMKKYIKAQINVWDIKQFKSVEQIFQEVIEKFCSYNSDSVKTKQLQIADLIFSILDILYDETKPKKSNEQSMEIYIDKKQFYKEFTIFQELYTNDLMHDFKEKFNEYWKKLNSLHYEKFTVEKTLYPLYFFMFQNIIWKKTASSISAKDGTTPFSLYTILNKIPFKKKSISQIHKSKKKIDYFKLTFSYFHSLFMLLAIDFDYTHEVINTKIHKTSWSKYYKLKKLNKPLRKLITHFPQYSPAYIAWKILNTDTFLMILLLHLNWLRNETDMTKQKYNFWNKNENKLPLPLNFANLELILSSSGTINMNYCKEHRDRLEEQAKKCYKKIEELNIPKGLLIKLLLDIINQLPITENSKLCFDENSSTENVFSLTDKPKNNICKRKYHFKPYHKKRTFITKILLTKYQNYFQSQDSRSYYSIGRNIFRMIESITNDFSNERLPKEELYHAWNVVNFLQNIEKGNHEKSYDFYQAMCTLRKNIESKSYP